MNDARRISLIARMIGEKLEGLELPRDIGFAVVITVPQTVGSRVHELMTLVPHELDRRTCYMGVQQVAQQMAAGGAPRTLGPVLPPRGQA